ncbi:MAG TPA: tetratricopeptide repeat protein [Candidatus Bathyarchaeia archaeon]|nr:tetratricopeptide repeat protein [Candidatus Bathyarchaeia archaeon]
MFVIEAAGGSKRKTQLPDFDNLWDYDHPGGTERKFRELLPAALDSLDLTYLSQLLTQIARTEGLQRKFQDAHKTLDRVQKALDKTDDKTRVRYLLERGRVLNSSRKHDEARPLFLEALDLAQKSKDDFNTVDAAHMMAIVEPTEKQLQWNLKALGIAENSAEEKARKWRGSLYNNIGWTYFEQQQYEEALLMFEKALEFRKQEGDPSKVMIANWCVAKVLRMMDHTEEALEMQRNLFEQNQAAGKKSGYVYEEIAECLLILGQEQEARGWFAAAYEELSQDPRLANEQERLNRLKELGKVGRPEPHGTFNG